MPSLRKGSDMRYAARASHREDQCYFLFHHYLFFYISMSVFYELSHIFSGEIFSLLMIIVPLKGGDTFSVTLPWK